MPVKQNFFARLQLKVAANKIFYLTAAETRLRMSYGSQTTDQFFERLRGKKFFQGGKTLFYHPSGIEQIN
jgi:hypothetical protein